YDVVPEGEEKNASIFLLTIHNVKYENKVGDLIFQVGLYRGKDLDPNQIIGYSSANFVALKNEVFANSSRIQKFNLVS
ncbi:MAG: hypothetical protein K2H85_00270, partial [Allobaculum sp.]|nr:hypothetical protein [Allobaculum sp.]